MAINLLEFRNPNGSIPLRAARGHFATSHSHINYYVDLTQTRHMLSEAREAAIQLASTFKASTVIDTILCLDGTEVLGACMASELTKTLTLSINSNRPIFVVTPDRGSGSQLIFRDNTAPMIVGKRVLILGASVTTGFTAKGALEAVQYYGGTTVGICCLFSLLDEFEGYPVHSIFDANVVLPDYKSTISNNCALCRAGIKLDGMINAHGISTL